MKKIKYILIIIALFALTLAITSCGTPREISELESLSSEDLPLAIIELATEKTEDLSSYTLTLDGDFIVRSSEGEVAVDFSEHTTVIGQGRQGYETLTEKSTTVNDGSGERITNESYGYISNTVFYEYTSSTRSRAMKSYAPLGDYLSVEDMREEVTFDLEDFCEACYVSSGKINGDGTLQASFTDIDIAAIAELEKLLYGKRAYLGSDFAIDNAAIVVKTSEDLAISSILIDVFFRSLNIYSSENNMPSLSITVEITNHGKAKSPTKNTDSFQEVAELTEIMKLPYALWDVTEADSVTYEKNSETYATQNGSTSSSSQKRSVSIKNEEDRLAYDISGVKGSFSSSGSSYKEGKRTSLKYNLFGNVISSTSTNSSDDAERYIIYTFTDELFFSPSTVRSAEIYQDGIKLTLDTPSDLFLYGIEKKDYDIEDYSVTVVFSISDSTLKKYSHRSTYNLTKDLGSSLPERITYQKSAEMTFVYD